MLKSFYLRDKRIKYLIDHKHVKHHERENLIK